MMTAWNSARRRATKRCQKLQVTAQLQWCWTVGGHVRLRVGETQDVTVWKWSTIIYIDLNASKNQSFQGGKATEYVRDDSISVKSNSCKTMYCLGTCICEVAHKEKQDWWDKPRMPSVPQGNRRGMHINRSLRYPILKFKFGFLSNIIRAGTRGRTRGISLQEFKEVAKTLRCQDKNILMQHFELSAKNPLETK